MEAGGQERGKEPLRVLLVALGLLLVVGSLPLASADYLQASVDPARTGVSPDVGPVRDDMAFMLELPGTIASHPLIFEGAVYAAIRAVDVDGLATDGVVRVDLDTAEMDVIIETDGPPAGIASDGAMLYVLRNMGLDAYPIDGGAPVWSWDHDPFTTLPEKMTTCRAPGVTVERLFLLCEEVAMDAGTPFLLETPPGVPPQAHPGGSAEAVTFLVALDTTSGEAHWTWSDPLAEGPVADLHIPRLAAPLPLGALGGVAVVAGHVVAMYQQPSLGGAGEAYVRSFSLEEGEVEWSHTISLADQGVEAGENQDTGFVEGTRHMRVLGSPTGDPDEVYYAVRDVVGVRPSSGAETWRHPLPQVDDDLVGGEALALAGDDLYAASRGVLFKLDRAAQTIVWDSVIGAGEHFDSAPLILAGGILYARTHGLFDFVGPVALEDPQEDPERNPEYFYAYNPEDGNLLWKHKVFQDPDRYHWNGGSQFLRAIADGVMAIQGMDGTLRVLGATAASLVPVVDPTETYPGIGEDVSVDLSATEPGVHGPATEYRAAWGDGTVTEWQSDPVMTHAYASGGEHTAELSVRNEAGQTATTTAMFHVGETAPNFLSTAFAPENQDMTFGVLGVALALAGGGIGLAHRRRRRGRLARELEAIQAVHEASHHEPDVCARLLLERKTQARALAAEGKLDQAQLHIIETRIDELTRALRITEIEEAFDFLPVAFVKSLRTVLEDGQVTRYERASLLDALEQEPVLTDEQKALVRERLVAWFGAD